MNEKPLWPHCQATRDLRAASLIGNCDPLAVVGRPAGGATGELSTLHFFITIVPRLLLTLIERLFAGLPTLRAHSMPGLVLLDDLSDKPELSSVFSPETDLTPLRCHIQPVYSEWALNRLEADPFRQQD